MSKSTALITGVTGFLGSQVCHSFLRSGLYNVRGTVRDTSNESKVAPLRHAFKDDFHSLELVPANLNDAESIDAAVQGANYVVHTASPFPLGRVRDEQGLIDTAVNGTLAVMKACRRHRVKRVVVTSSMAAISDLGADLQEKVLTEEDWSDPTRGVAYSKSKTLAEQAAWNYVQSLPEEEKFELVVINPSLIMGPALVKGEFSSGQIISKIMTGRVPFLPAIHIGVVDVRDVAKMHLLGAQLPEAANQRFIATSESFWMKDMAQILKNQYGNDYKISTKELGVNVARFAAILLKDVKELLPLWKLELQLSNEKARRVMGMDFISGEEAIVAMAESLIQSGMVQDRRKKKRAK